MKATPIVAIVLHELPVRTEMMLQTMHVTTRKNVGLRICRPYSISTGTTPLSIHVVPTMAMQINIGTAGSICRALRIIPDLIPRRLRLPHAAARTIQSKAADKSESVLKSDIASAPAMTIIPVRKTRSTIIGRREIQSGGVLALRFNKLEIFNCLCSILCNLGKSNKISKKTAVEQLFSAI